MNIPSQPEVAALLVILHAKLIVEILTFLDVKSLIRMKCVCKSWKTLFSDPLFVKMHLKRQSTRMTHLALFSKMSQGSVDCRAVPISRLLDTTSNSITLTDDDPYYQFNFKNARCMVGSCNGLVCLQGCSSDSAAYIDHSFSFWNPATRNISETLMSFRQYDNSDPREYICRFLFGYDNSTDTYKVVSFGLKIEDSLMTSSGVYFNNSINWFARHRYNCHLITIEQFVIISVELGTETYTQLLLPRCCEEELRDPPILPPTLSMLNDCLCFSYDFKKTYFIIWQMKEFGVEESWVEFVKISYLNFQMDYSPRVLVQYGYVPELIVNPLCVSGNGDMVIFAINRLDQVIHYNRRDNRVKRIKSPNQIWWFDAKGYVESLVSTSRKYVLFDNLFV
ncbi:F-box and associated interaction domain protein [Medicago truncatula]|uniref:F-box and associated interaction domain protein n=1 Tax=Medicago truncatula TaxID=3880 RepID=A0A072U8V0_MEDTR|nr:F-box and associated interaction domain protein [Medicago truncatula]